MDQTAARIITDYLSAAYEMLDESGSADTASRRRGFARIGSQVAQFQIEALLRRNVERGRQILFANVPSLCKTHSLDSKIMFEIIGEYLESFPENAVGIFFLEVVLHHQTAASPVKPNVRGCLFPFALAVSGLSAVAAVGYRLV